MIASHQKLFLTLIYVVLVHIIDLSLYYNNIDYFISSTGIDFFKLIFWLVIPLLLSIKNLDIGFFSFKRVKRIDFVILYLISFVGIFAVLLIPFMNDLNSYYVIENKLSDSEKLEYISYQMKWIFSWLIGWEFIHRYFIIKSIDIKKENIALWILPVIECLYHINKPWPEMIGVLIFSWILTKWTLKRSSLLLPLLAHFIIEVELIIFQLYF